MVDRVEAADRFYALLGDLAGKTGGPRHLTDAGLAQQCPRAGLYFFFEPGEIRADGTPRVVRIGTHALTATSRATLWGRLRQHLGRVGGSNPGGGNHRGSIFRRHIGSALLQQRGDTDLLASWMAKNPSPELLTAERALELEVSSVIRGMPFMWLSVPTRADGTSDRGILERNLIALLSTMAGGCDAATAGWLGRFAVASKVRESSLWNVNHVDDTFDPGALDLMAEYIGGLRPDRK